MATDTGTPAVRTDKGAYGDRLPVAPRQRRPALAALALLLILGGGLISAVLVVRSGQKEAIIALRQDVPSGHVITDADLVSLPAALPDGYPAVPWEQRNRVIGGTAGADLKKGTILNPRVVSRAPLPSSGQVAVGLLLKPGDQFPEGLRAGQHVMVLFALSSQASTTTTLPKGFTEGSEAVVVGDAVIFSVSRPRSDQTVTVKLIVKKTDAKNVVQLARQSAVALVELPTGG